MESKRVVEMLGTFRRHGFNGGVAEYQNLIGAATIEELIEFEGTAAPEVREAFLQANNHCLPSELTVSIFQATVLSRAHNRLLSVMEQRVNELETQLDAVTRNVDQLKKRENGLLKENQDLKRTLEQMVNQLSYHKKNTQRLDTLKDILQEVPSGAPRDR